MTRDTPYDSLEFLVVLSREFPHDPEALYAATHAYSDLSLRSSQDLARDAPFSYQVHKLNAEALELQGKWDEAAAEYRKILEINPTLQGIHAQLGRALLSKPQPSPTDVEQAKKNFEEELEIDPRNAVAEYVLGQLAADAKDSSTAIQHFTQGDQAGFRILRSLPGTGNVVERGQALCRGRARARDLRKDGARQPNGTLSVGARLRRHGPQRGRESRGGFAAPDCGGPGSGEAQGSHGHGETARRPLRLRSRSRMSRFPGSMGTRRRFSPVPGRKSRSPHAWPFRVCGRPQRRIRSPRFPLLPAALRGSTPPGFRLRNICRSRLGPAARFSTTTTTAGWISIS